MNKGFQLITLLLLLLCGPDSAWAQLDTIPPIDHQLVTAEYFWDVDPGSGNGTALIATDGNIDEVVENLLNSGINVPAPLGAHLFHVRIMDLDGNWSPVFRTLVNSYDLIATDSVPAIKVAQAEYFWDADPGEGFGNPMLAFDGAFDEAVEAVFQNGITVPGATVPHTFNIRFRSEHDGWGALFRTIVHPYTPSLSDSFPPIKITQAEYFWDTDPGQGNGNPMLAFDGAFNEAVEAAFQNGITVPVTEGPHIFNIRYRSEHDEWGAVFSTIVHSYSPSVSDSFPAIKLTQAEYFWDTDPGQGNGSPMLAFDGAFDEAVESVFTNGLTPPNPIGPNEFNVRFRNEEGDWGSLFRTIIYSYLPSVTDSFPAISIVQAEYFWDTDPGEGSGTPLLALDGTIDEVVETLFKNDISHPMPCGAHRFNVRAKSLEGDWGLPFSSIVYVVDTLPPVSVCQNITVQLDASGTVSLDSNAIDGGSSDNCEIVAFVLDTAQYNCSDIGDHPVMMTITDFVGFMDSCSATVTVQDTVPPTALCQDITIHLDASGVASVTPGEVHVGSSDACGVSTVLLSNTLFGCADTGIQNIVLTVTDINGNAQTCNATATIVDPFIHVSQSSASICQGDSFFVQGSWQTSSGIYFDTISSAFSPCDSILATDLTVLANQDIVVAPGWNIISSFMTTNDMSMESLFDDIDHEILIVKDGAGTPYIPSIPLNMIGDWELRQGYKVKAQTGVLYSMGCDQADPLLTPLPLPEGWSMISYLREGPLDAAAALASLGDTVVVAKSNDGNMYIPNLVNGIGDLQPGQGYQVKLSEPATLLYPANTVRISGESSFTGNSRAVHYSINRNTGNNASIVIPNGSIEGLEYGDEIGVFNSRGSLVGSAIYEDSHMAFAVWGTDALIGGNENMSDGEPYRYRIWRPSLNEEFLLHVEYESGFPHFTTNGLSYIKSGIAEGLIPDVLDLEAQVFVYPTPANLRVNVEVWLSESSDVLITIHDLAGKEVFHPRQEQLDKGEHVLQLDISQLAVGTYYYQIKTTKGSFNGSLIKLKW